MPECANKKIERTVESLEEYMSVIEELRGQIRVERGIRETLYYRGHSDNSYTLMPGIGRCRPVAELSERQTAFGDSYVFTETVSEFEVDGLVYSKHAETYLENEKNMIDEVMLEHPEYFPTSLKTSPLGCVALLQHYGLPTRLLDITGDPRVALYFACEKNFDKEGEVIAFKNPDEQSFKAYPIREAVADSCNLLTDSIHPLRRFYKDALATPYFKSQKNQAKRVLRSAKARINWVYQNCRRDNILFVHADKPSVRQKNQAAGYILFPNSINHDDGVRDYKIRSWAFMNYIKPMSKNGTNIPAQITVPSGAKQNILDELAAVGITKNFIYPASEEDLHSDLADECERVREKYSPQR